MPDRSELDFTDSLWHKIVGRTMQEFVLHLYVCSLGFALAGICASGSRLITGIPLKFTAVPNKDAWSILFAVSVRLVAGPFLLVRNSILEALAAKRSASWLALSVMFATIWSFFSGVIVIELLFTFSS